MADALVNLPAVFLLFIVGVMGDKYNSVVGAAAALLLSTFATAITRIVAISRAGARVGEEVRLHTAAGLGVVSLIVA
jgi:hypothetical protein